MKVQTTTSLVEEVLKANEQDFVSTREIVERTGRSVSQVSAALHHLRNRHVADVVVEKDGTGWWFYTAEYDNRSFKRGEYKEHTKPNRKPKKKV